MISAEYDDFSDVLYVHDSPKRAYGDETPDGLLVRYAYDSGAVCGVTVFDFGQLWGRREAELACRIAALLSVSEADVQKAIAKATHH